MALVILLVVSLALTQSALVGMSTNVENSLRDEAVNVADMRMSQLESRPFTDAVTDTLLLAPGNTPPEATVTRNLRHFTITYTLTRTITDISPDSKQITITVAWSYKGKTYTHGTTSIMRKQQ